MGPRGKGAAATASAGYYTIKDWPAEDRPREKLAAQGEDRLTEAELVAIILRTGNAAEKQTAVDMARAVLKRFGSLADVATASIAEITQVPGVGPAKAASLKAAFELGRRVASHALPPGRAIATSADVAQHFHQRLKDLRKETFWALLLDSKHRVMREVKISEGALNATVVHPREVFAPVVRESAAAVIFVHNHPSGDPAPSDEDRDITARLLSVGRVMGVRILDHLVIGREGYYSFADEGALHEGE